MQGVRNPSGHGGAKEPLPDGEETKELGYKAGGHAARVKLRAGVPSDGVVHPRTNDPIAPPSPVKTFPLGNPNLRGELAILVPANSSIVLYVSPDVAGDRLERPLHVVETAIVSRNPELPESDALQERPDGVELAEAARETLGEDAVLPIEGEMDRGVTRLALERVNES